MTKVSERYGGIVGSSERMVRLYEQLDRAAAVDLPVLICGETGTGKELVARELHDRSPRSRNPFIDVNMGVLTKDLAASELFGHAKGAFTGAHERSTGKFTLADKGSIFLDEIGTMDDAIQVVLLRVLQEGRFTPVGGKQIQQADVRVIAATNMDLRRAAAEGTFREDLLYRLEVLQLSLPPLRQRREDIPELVSHFLEMARRNFGCDVRAFEDDALEVLCSYAWPGNIRELKNVVAQAAVMSDRDVVSAHHLPRRMRPPAHEEALEPTSEEAYDQAFPSAEPATPAERQPAPEPSSAKPEPPAPAQDGVFIPVGATLEEVQEAYIRKVLEQCSGNKTQAAKTLGISRKTLYERLKRWDDEA